MAQQFTNTAILEQKSFMSKVYGLMAMGLLITAVISFLVSTNQILVAYLFSNKFLYIMLFVVELFIVGYLASRVRYMKYSTAINLFIAYSVINGITLSFIFLAYTRASIFSAFFTTAGMFGIMSIYGYTTKKDLASVGNFLFMGLIGIIIASIVNIFMRNSVFDLLISILGVIIFTGLTAYDTQKIKNYLFLNSNSEEDKKSAIMGALTLYLDFINLFLMLLRLMGRSRN
ncbi:MAG: Bax inhibitor-1/YccA family protein [Elusimicrobiota bacterium]|jgi:FtsH-binding integral membrane protein|nr:Bax inhibitor-1/YccA family protein [Elusimicrobiota bacterium]